MLSKAEKDAIAGAAQRIVERFVIPPGVEPWRACLWYTFGALPFLERILKRKVIPQGGTASWRRVRDEDDDGIMPTHYSYQFDLDHPMTTMSIVLRQLPEMHCWLAVPSTGDIIDLSVKHQARACHENTGMQWTGDPLPEYLWLNVNDPEQTDYVYRGQREATAIAIEAGQSCVRFLYPRTPCHSIPESKSSPTSSSPKPTGRSTTSRTGSASTGRRTNRGGGSLGS